MQTAYALLVGWGAVALLGGAAACGTSSDDAPPASGGSAGNTGNTAGAGGSALSGTGGAAGPGGMTGDSGRAAGGSSGRASAAGAGGSKNTSGAGGKSGSGGSAMNEAGAPGTAGSEDNPLANPDDGPAAGNPAGACDIPAEAGLEDSSAPDHVVGTGTPESCTGDAVVAAVAAGGVITFDCGKEPITITLTEPAKVFNDASDKVVLDGGGKVTLSGGGTTRILYMNTCDEAQHWTTEHCDDQPYPELTVQNITFTNGNAKAYGIDTDGGGGAIYASGGRFKAVNTRFLRQRLRRYGAGRGWLRARVPAVGRQAGVRRRQHVRWRRRLRQYVLERRRHQQHRRVLDDHQQPLSYNHAIGNGGNPADSGTPGGGSGGAIYNDGNTMTLSICGSLIEHNDVKAYGSAIFFVSNDMTGTLRIHDSVIRENTGGGWNVLPGISMHDTTVQDIQNSTIE